MWRAIQVFWQGSRLRSKDSATRIRAAVRLGELRGGAAIARLSRAVHDSDERARLHVIDALGKTQDPRAVAPLVQVLVSAAENERWSDWTEAARALASLRAAEAVEPIVALFSKGRVIPDHVHEKAMEVVAEIGDGRGALVALYRMSSDRGKIPRKAENCLRQLGPAAIETLRQELLKRRWGSIAEVLAMLGWKPSTQEERIMWALARPQRELLAAEGAAAIEPMRMWYLTHRSDERRLLLPHFGAMPAGAVGPVLLELLQNNAEDEEPALIELIGRKQVAAAIPVLVKWLRPYHGKGALEGAIVAALVRIGVASAGPVQQAMLDGHINLRSGLTVLRQVGGVRIESRLVELTGHPDAEVRRLASETLQAAGWKPATQEDAVLAHISRGEWVQAVRSGSDVRQRLADAIGAAGHGPPEPELFRAAAMLREPMLVEPLVECALQDNAAVADAAAGVLMGLGEMALPALFKKLDGMDPDDAAAAGRVLARIGEPAVPGLLARLKDPARRGPAAHALHAMGRKADDPAQAVEILIGQGKLLEAAALGAVAVEPLLQLFRLWSQTDPHAREPLAIALGRTGALAAAPPLLEVLRTYPNHTPLWAAAAMSLAQLRDRRALPLLLSEVEKEHSHGVAAAATALGKFGDLAALPLLLKRLDDRKSDVVAAVANALADLGDRRAIEPLLRVLKRNTDSGRPWDEIVACRAAVAPALGRFGDVNVILPLLQAIQYHKKGPVYEGALAAFPALGEKALKPLLAIVQGEECDERPAAVAALVQLDSPQVRPTLLKALSDKPAVREMAARMLPQTGWTPADDADRARVAIAAADFDAVAKLGAAAIEPLVQLIVTRDPWAAGGAATLARLRGPGVIEGMSRLLRQPSSEVYLPAVEALCGWNDPRVRDALLAELADPAASADVKRLILRHVGRFADERVVRAVLALFDADPTNNSVQIALSDLAKTRPKVPQALGLAKRLAPNRPAAERLSVMDMLRLLSSEQQAEILESLVDDPDEVVRNAVWSKLESLISYIKRGDLAVLVCLRKIGHGSRGEMFTLKSALERGARDTPTPVLQRILELSGYTETSEIAEYRQLDANQDAGHVVITREIHHHYDYHGAQEVAREELRRRGVVV